MGHVAATVTEERDGEPGEFALVFLNGLQVGEQLARVELVAQRVDNRNARAIGHFFETGLRERAPHNRGDLAFEHACRVGDALFAGELTVTSLNDKWLTAEVGDADGETHARARRRLVEDDRDRLRAVERAVREAVRLDLGCECEHLSLFGWA